MQKRSGMMAKLALLTGVAATGFVAPGLAEAPRLVSSAVDNAQTMMLPGNVRPEAVQANNRGPVDDSLVLDHMQMLLARPDSTERELVRFIDAQQDPASPHYHHWLTAREFGERFGPASADVDTVVAWLQSQGFTVNGVQAGRMMIDFSGTAAQVRTAFQTQIHNFELAGVHHIANMTNPRVPAALAGVVRGIVSLHDFKPHTNFKPRPAYTFSSGGSESSSSRTPTSTAPRTGPPSAPC